MNSDDPGCTLTYGFLLRGDMMASVLEDALYALMCGDYPSALSTFVRKESGLHVYPAAAPEYVLEYVESAPSGHSGISPVSAVLLPENRLFRFTLTKLSEHVHHLRLTFSHLIFDGQCYRIFCTLLTRLYGQGSVRSHLLSDAQRPRRLPPGVVAIQSADTVAFWKERLCRYPLGQTLSFLKAQNRGATPFVTQDLSTSIRAGMLFEGYFQMWAGAVFTVIAHPPGALARHQGEVPCLSSRLFKEAS
jgi:hypothetical protein